MRPLPCYQVILTWSDQDHTIHAEMPELPGCVAHGATYIGALVAALKAIDIWVEQAQRAGRPLPDAHLRPLAEVRAALLAEAKADGRMQAARDFAAGPTVGSGGATNGSVTAKADTATASRQQPPPADRWSLAAIAWSQAELLIAEPAETENVKALAEAYQHAYEAGYREEARKHGWKRLDEDETGDES